MNDYQVVNPVNAEIMGCQEKFLYVHYLTFLSIVKQLFTLHVGNRFLLLIILEHSEVCVSVHFSVSLSEQIRVIKVNLEVSGKVLDI